MNEPTPTRTRRRLLRLGRHKIQSDERPPWEDQFAKNGGGRTLLQYTLDARKFFLDHRDRATPIVLEDGPGVEIRIGLDTEDGPKTIGGIWTPEGRVIEFADLRSYGES